MDKEEPENTHRTPVKCSISFNIYICGNYPRYVINGGVRLLVVFFFKDHFNLALGITLEKTCYFKGFIILTGPKEGGIACP